MILLQILKVVLIVLVVLFLLTLPIYFFNLDMKFAVLLIKPLTWWYNYSDERRKRKKDQAK